MPIRTALPTPAAASASAVGPRAGLRAGLRATSVKTPHWVLLGFEDRLARRRESVTKVRVHDTDLAVFRDSNDSLQVALDACPHRGASLSSGGTVRGECVVCPYHARSVGRRGHRERFFDHVTKDGLVWLDYASGMLTQGQGPASYPEHADPAMRTFGYTKVLDVNPVLMTENTLDWQHLATVHRVHFIKGAPRVTIRENGLRGRAEYAYQSDLFDLVIDNEYHAPFTTSLRFRFTDRRTGRPLAPLLLWFSVSPMSRDKVALHLRVSRGVLRSPLADWLFRLIDELPLAEDAWVVANTDASAWSTNALDSGDTFVAGYRKAMRDFFPEVLDWYVS
jgi:phenylpropionate dioxygenase-like ring-hydroxylating dioxygenase large terminal subunit